MKNLLLSILIIGLSSCAIKKKKENTMSATPVKKEMTKPPVVVMEAAPPPPPAPKVRPRTEEVFKVVEQMPHFPGCEDIQNNSREQKTCADTKMLTFIKQNLQYPEEAKNKAIQGTCIVSFIVEKTGKLSDIKLMRSLEGGCGEEALRVVNEMNKQGVIWISGKQRGRLVAVRLNIPISFKLN